MPVDSASLVPAASPWAMQLAARVEKTDPPSTEEICAAAARAVISLLEHDNANEDGPWVAALEAWQAGGRIRKLVRRGRASAWARAQEAEGCSARFGRAEVRAYVPCPMDVVPSAVAKLQIQSTALERPERRDTVPTEAGGLLIVVTPEVEMSWGKAAAQCAHAAQRLHQASGRDRRRRWEENGRPVGVVHASPTLWAREIEAATVRVADGGFTEIPAGTLTTVARWVGG